jgi:hypothetical protein
VRVPFFLLALALVLGAASPVFAALDVSALVEQSVRHLDLQTEMPGEVEAPNQWFDLRLSGELVRWALWGAVVVGVLVVIWSLRDSLPVLSRSRKIAAPEEVLPSSARSGRMDEAQLEADDLARQGQYGEAMHVLLFKSLNEIRRQLGVSFAISLTSREILRRIQLSDAGRRALAAIILSVERTYFGGQQASQEDYSDCRSHFDTLRHLLATFAVP